jgi:hypothetical protein
MKKLLKLAFLLLCLGGLFAFQRDAVMPNVYKVISSDLFLVDSDDLGDNIAITNSMAGYAHRHCNDYLRNEYGEDYRLTLAENAINTWDLGNHDYVVNSELTAQPKEGPSLVKKYVCRIRHDDDDANNFDNWSLYGVSGLDDL